MKANDMLLADVIEFGDFVAWFVSERNKGSKHYIDTMYSDLRKSLETIIRNHLSLTNSIVIAETTVLKNGKCVCLQSWSYSFSLDGYFKHIVNVKTIRGVRAITNLEGYKMIEIWNPSVLLESEG